MQAKVRTSRPFQVVLRFFALALRPQVLAVSQVRIPKMRIISQSLLQVLYRELLEKILTISREAYRVTSGLE